MKINPNNITQTGMRRAASWARVIGQSIDHTLSMSARGHLSPEQTAAEIEEPLNDFWECILLSLGSPPDPTPAEIADELQDIADAIQSAHDDRSGMQSAIDALTDFITTLKK